MVRKAIHFKAVFVYIFLLLGLQFVAVKVSQIKGGSVLSYASNININDLLKDTNLKRAERGLSPVKLDSQLSQAAEQKGESMFAEQYWAHTSPSGKDPWSFINGVGYHYIYAGENLARDFADSTGVVEAWVNSPSHRENLLNSRYQDVGFAVLNGKYGDYETTLVVQEFGTRASAVPSVQAEGPAAQSPAAVPTVPKVIEKPVSQTSPVVQSEPTTTLAAPVVAGTESNLPLNIFQITKAISLLLSGFLIVMLVIDGIMAYRFKFERVTGHNSAHLLFFIGLTITVLLLQRGLVI